MARFYGIVIYVEKSGYVYVPLQLQLEPLHAKTRQHMDNIFYWLEIYCLLCLIGMMIVLLCNMFDDDCQPIDIQDENNNQRDTVTANTEVV